MAKDLVIHIDDIDIPITNESLKEVIHNYLDSETFDQALDKIVEKNKHYGDAWKIDGLFTNFGDIKEKLVRLEIVVKDGNIQHKQTAMDNYGNVIFDLFARSLLIMCLDNKIEQYIKEH